MRDLDGCEQPLDAELDAAVHEIEHFIELVGGRLERGRDVLAGRRVDGFAGGGEPSHDRGAVHAVHLGELFERDAAEEVQAEQVAIAAGCIRDRIRDLADAGMTLDQVKATSPARGWTRQFGAASGPWTTDMFVEAIYKTLPREKKP